MSETTADLEEDIENELTNNLELSKKSSSANPPNSTENEIINVDEIELSDEDTWLYESPNSKCKETELSPYKWLRKDVEDLNNRELQLAKTALVSKLDELEYQKATAKKSQNIEKPNKTNHVTKIAISEKNCDILDGKESSTIIDDSNDSSTSSSNGQSHKAGSSSGSQSQIDVVDIFEKARRQEQSLNESSLKFFSQAVRTLPRSTHLISPTSITSSKLQKPASIEALHVYNGRQAVPSVNSSPRTNTSSPNRSPYGSNVSLNFSNDGHRSSLPNLNKGYYSLKKKSRGSNEVKTHCPLPIYPKSEMNAALQEAAHLKMGKIAMKSPVESHTLPSSYRAKSKSISNSSGDYPRRESLTSPQWGLPRQGSNPNISQQRDVPNGRFVSSPRKGASSPSLQNLRTVSLSQLSPDSHISPIKEYPRHHPMGSASRSCSIGEDGVVVKGKVELARKSSLPTRIPSPAVRSGIPVPSFQNKTSPTKNGWERNCR